MEFEDQSVIKGKFDQIGIRPIRVSYLGDGESKKCRERKKKKKKKKKKKRKKAKKGMDKYGLLWVCMDISFFHV